MKFSHLKHLVHEGTYDELIKGLYAYYPKIRALVLKHNGSEDDARDVFQEGLLVFINKLEDPGFNLSCKPETFLYSVCHNLWRIQQRQLSKESKIVAVELPDMSHQALEETIEKERRLISLEHVLSKIGEKCQTILKLYYFQKNSMKEIAQKLQLSSVQMAKNRKYKCLEKARDLVRNSQEQVEISTSTERI